MAASYEDCYEEALTDIVNETQELVTSAPTTAALRFELATEQPPARPQEPRAYATVWQKGGQDHTKRTDLGSDYRNAHSSMDEHGVGSW